MAHNLTKIINQYFSGWAQKDWNKIREVLTDDFTFTSPNGDDYKLTVDQYKNTCWPWPDEFQKIEIDQVFQKEGNAFVRYKIYRKDGPDINNTEYFQFRDGKIKAVEVYFGRPIEALIQ